jgi:hypothetical protein
MDTVLATPRHLSIDALNSQCFCLSLDEAALTRALDLELGGPGLAEMVRQRCPFVFAAQPVFVGAAQLQRMTQVMQAIESVVALPSYREQVLASAPSIARFGMAGPQGVFFGYDFHLNQDRLGLIEINTNAGGAMLNAVLARAQRTSCGALEPMVPTSASVTVFEERIVEMFRHEWHLAGRTGQLSSVAIVDMAPEDQYLYPEFLLFQQLFERHGMLAVIADPSALEWRGGLLWHGDVSIDLVYNRLTDFYLEQVSCTALRDAYLGQAVVLTPTPQAHALYADKRQLALFSDAQQLTGLGVPEATQAILLEHVPRTEVVNEADAQRLWDARRGLFFKPVAGFGGRATYRGDKLTRRVWQDILSGDYVAQAIVAPGVRMVADTEALAGSDGSKAMKFDLRAYAYNGAVQWFAARVYQGQTTNFRTPGGGFAPVYSTTDVSGRTLQGCAGGNNTGTANASYVFFLDEVTGVHAVPHSLYVAIADGQATAPTLAGRTLRLADWYVRLQNSEPHTVVSETYSRVRFDAQGRVDWASKSATSAHPAGVTPSIEEAGLAIVTLAERERMRELLFGSAGSPYSPSRVAPTAESSPHCSSESPVGGDPVCR